MIRLLLVRLPLESHHFEGFSISRFYLHSTNARQTFDELGKIWTASSNCDLYVWSAFDFAAMQEVPKRTPPRMLAFARACVPVCFNSGHKSVSSDNT